MTKQNITDEEWGFIKKPVQTRQGITIRKTYPANDPKLKSILENPETSSQVVSIFFKYDDGPPRTVTEVELLIRN
ncbi:MAG: hypothetical protein HQM14_02540 [SAR324 cluster bacterium]|nr:hypothetical protein [SAR324 cluster bacterium]